MHPSHCTRLLRALWTENLKNPQGKSYTCLDFSQKSDFFWGKENKKIWNMNVLQFPTIHHVPNIYNLGFYFLFIFFLAEVKLWKKINLSLFRKHTQTLRSSSAIPESVIQYAILAGERWASFIRQKGRIKWSCFQNLPYLTVCSIWGV